MKKRMLSLALALVASLSLLSVASSAESASPFTDVKGKNWFYSDVMYVYEKSIMKGTSETKFEPKTPLTRYMYVTIIYRISGDTGKYPNKFTDVQAGKWYSDAVGWAQDTGIVEGYRDGRFHGNNKITRQEMAVMTARYLSYSWADLPDSASAVGKYADESKIAKWAKPSFETVRRIGLMLGDQNGNANPGALATRAETAALVGRLHKSLLAADKTPRIGGNPLEGYTVCSDLMRENELEDLRNVLKEAAGIDLPAAATADGKKIAVVEDDSLERLSYTLEEKEGDLILTLFSRYAVDHAAEIMRAEIAKRAAFTVPTGFSTTGTFLLQEATSSDGLEFLCETDKNPVSYRTGEQVTFRGSLLRNGRLVSVPKMSWEYRDDAGTFKTGVEEGYSGQIIVQVQGCSVPGAGRMNVYLLSKKGYRISALSGVTMNGGVVFDIEKIAPAEEEPEDFDEFWDGKMSELLLTEPVAEEYYDVPGRDGWDVYSIRISSPWGSAYAHVTVPQGAESRSLKIRSFFDGYGVGSAGYNYYTDAICVNVNPHSIENDRDENYYGEKRVELDGFGFDFPSRDEGYQLGMLMRDIQAIRFVEKEFSDLWNGVDISTNGGSMGGFQAVATAALYKKVNRVETSITWMCDMGGQSGRRISGWCPDYSDAAAYYDSCYFASRVTCPTSVNCALADDVCPACGLCALYNALGGEKAIAFKQNATHGYGGGAYNAIYTVVGDPLSIDPMYREIPVTGVAVYFPEDGERELTPEEKEIAGMTEKLEKERFVTVEFVNSWEVTAELLEGMIKDALTSKYGLSEDCTVEVSADQLSELQRTFSEWSAGSSNIVNVEYTVRTPSGGHVDSFYRVMFSRIAP